MTSFFKTLFLTVVILSNVLFLTTVQSSENNNRVIRLATTTSTENSGLLTYLLNQFEKQTQYKVHVVAVGTGKALRMGRDGDIDVLLVHALKEELQFVAEGYGDKRFPVMHNDFVMVGPKDDIGSLSNIKSIDEALTFISKNKKRFISRGDNSGTHKKERSLWKKTKPLPNSKNDRWYLEAGQGMGKVLNMAGEMDAFTLTDRGTWLAFEKKSPLAIAFEGDSKLFNPYGIIAISDKRYPDVNKMGAMALINWITSDKGQHLIGQFKVEGKCLFTPSTSSIANKSTK